MAKKWSSVQHGLVFSKIFDNSSYECHLRSNERTVWKIQPSKMYESMTRNNIEMRNHPKPHTNKFHSMPWPSITCKFPLWFQKSHDFLEGLPLPLQKHAHPVDDFKVNTSSPKNYMKSNHPISTSFDESKIYTSCMVLREIVLFFRESWCFQRQSRRKHQDSRENKTNWWVRGNLQVILSHGIEWNLCGFGRFPIPILNLFIISLKAEFFRPSFHYDLWISF